jgi:hypothetical protein
MLMDAAAIRGFVQDALAFFDTGNYTFGSLIKTADVLELAGLHRINCFERQTLAEYRERALLELRLVEAFRDAVLEHRKRCLRQEGDHLRILHPEEQLKYGEEHYSKIAMRKLKRGQRVLTYTDTNDVQALNDAFKRLADVQDVLWRQSRMRKNTFE